MHLQFWQVTVLLLVLAGCSASDPPLPIAELPIDIVEAPTFNHDIAPLIFNSCSGCHRPEGAAPFSLLEYSEVAKRGRQIAEIVESGDMPPWLPMAQHHEFADARRLAEPEVKLITRWVANGMPEGSPDELPAAPVWAEGWQLGEPDHIIELAGDYLLPAEGNDVFRSFVLPVDLDSTRYIRSVEIRPENPRIIHHGVILKDPTRAGRLLDQADPAPGYAGMQQSNKITSPDGHFVGWTPGKMPKQGPDDMAWKLEPDSDLIAALHMLPSGKPEQVKLKIGLHFAEKRPSRKPAMIQLEIQKIDIPAGEAEYEIEDSFVVPADINVIGIYPHAHYLASRMEVIATEPSGRKLVLLYITDWDFNWQDDYRFAEPITLPHGTRIEMRYVYDNSAQNERNPHSPPQRVTYGELSTNEMGSLWIQVIPRKASDLGKLEQAINEKSSRQAVAGFRFALQQDPYDLNAANNLGAALSLEGKLTEARALFEQALSVSANHAPTHFNLGLMLFRSGDIANARLHLEKSASLNPKQVDALVQLGNLASAENDYPAAISYFQQALAVRSDRETYYNIGVTYLAMGQAADAIPYLKEAIKIDPDDPLTHLNLGACYFNTGDWTEAESHFRQTTRLAPESVPGHLNLGNSLIKQDQISKALSSFQRASQLDPNDQQARQSVYAAQQMLQDQ
ncbi:MAG: tetratricopeptide (TPR) repeat protein/mono/diheme cytochrome c family protein [Verrucomicrobiales bacterium]|jgi:tetratricopeptide (TPR) repeat protein/mono/diheme cytochrome c family protein